MLKLLSALYGGITDWRNRLYDSGFIKPARPTQYCIGVGNLTVGGTGKTPAVSYLIQLLTGLNHHATGKLATLSRGYGRQTKGFRIATPSDTAATLGDEPLELYRTLGQLATICVGERRAAALTKLAALRPDIGTVVLDDAFQHRAVLPQLQLLLMDYNRPFYTDEPFPGGRLRERRHGANRADLVIVTKCPYDPNPTERAQITQQISQYTRPKTPIIFAGLTYSAPIHFATNQPVIIKKSPVLLVTGLANAEPLVHYVSETFGLLEHVAFADHHAYSRADVERLLHRCPPNTWLLTTHKDQVKLVALLTNDELQRKLAYLPVAMQFFQLRDAATLKRMVADTLRQKLEPGLKNP
ncbi:tetraacyldisaccharide 4'-kinase [Fibrella aquatilis]|uniref:Tetraacyldisaccharide 4'-kinase n=1 Tax=Fibrella aquatilis TaxID=2817059 RepID=A0A939JUE6_9BACT|nr:tetraacyldisaccharide 4'-kinase [Fibrella aquatilis]MBO0929707.1 tetraacyldisaccharide 4'-kinase [Fibrella aquatilis]